LGTVKKLDSARSQSGLGGAGEAARQLLRFGFVAGPEDGIRPSVRQRTEPED
jgi:hypothetical protein